jgi:hypothetical protein
MEMPTYPPLARRASIQGEVRAHFDVSADGKPVNLVLAGQPLLKEPVESAITKTTLATSCEGSVDLIYQFAVSSEISHEAHTSVEFKAPNEFLVTTDHVPPIIDYQIVRRSWFRRLLHR